MKYKHTRMLLLSIAAIGAILFVNPAQALKLSDREGGFEITINPRYVSSASIDGSNGSKLDLGDAWGWGFGFGYNFTEKWNLAWDIGWNSGNYNTTVVDDDNNKEERTGTFSSSSTYFTGTYNILDKTFTPYVSGALGWVFIDSNIPSGTPGSGCWWTWYGYYCGGYVPTYSTTEFSYGLGLGLRWDVGKTVFLKAAYNKVWIDSFGTVGSQDFDTALLTLGFLLH